jgi:acetyl-CoA acetyltransferase
MNTTSRRHLEQLAATAARREFDDQRRQRVRHQRRRLRSDRVGTAAEQHGLQPVARVLGMASAGVAPRVMGIGPVSAIGKLLARLQMPWRIST